MPLNDPKVGSKKFSDEIGEDTVFVLDGIRTVSGIKTEYGEGEFVLLNVRGHDEELGIWGAYLVAQAKAADSSDFGKHYRITRKVIPEFSKREVKALVPYDPEKDEDIPF